MRRTLIVHRRAVLSWGLRVWLVVGGLGLVTPLAAQTEPPPDSVERDYSAELPRLAPLDPQAAQQSFRVATGYQLVQVAAEPLVTDPVAAAFDEHGRLYVVEMRDYSEDDKLRLGRVRLLEDEDRDGIWDKSVVFAEQLSWPTAVLCYGGGIFVGAAPDIVFLKDHDGDGRADESRIVFTGFGRGNVQGLLNSFQWGFDNRIHGATSSSGADVVRPELTGPAPISLRGRDFAYDPKTLELLPTTGGGQHGMGFDQWGDRFVCSNSDHVQQVMFEDRYAARNPYVAAPSPRQSIAVDGPQADVFRASPIEPWRILRTRLRMKGVVPGIVEGGGRAAGYFTSATGVTIYLGELWPADAYGQAIVGDVGGNLVHRKRLHRQGLIYSAERIDEKSEFVASTDIWFRPVQFLNAPDGSLYVLDMYREVIEHPASLHPVIKQHLDLTSGRDRGRIYSIRPQAAAPAALPRLSERSGTELVALLAHPNGWQRDTAARLIYERQDQALSPALEQLARTAALPEGRIRALYALDGLGTLAPPLLLRVLDDLHPQVRRHAVRLAERFLASDAGLRAKIPALADDEDLVVRYQVAFTLGAMGGAARDAALARLAVRDGRDAYVRFAVQSSLETGAGAVLALLAGDEQSRRAPGVGELIQSLAAQIGRQQRPDDVAAVLRVLSALADQAAAQQILAALAAPPDSPLAAQLAAATGGKAAMLLAGLLKEARATAANRELPPANRAEAVYRLQLSRWADQRELLAQLLVANEAVEVQEATLRTLAAFDDPDVATLVLDTWPTLTPSLRQRAGDLLLSRGTWLEALLDAVSQNRIPPGDVAAGHWQWLTHHDDPRVRERARELAQAARGNRDEILKAYQDALELAGDAERGRAVFKKTCSGCHQLEGVGHAIGPNLAAMKNRGAEAVLSNVLVPNAEVNPQFMTYVVTTNEGRALNGIIAEESAGSVTLQRAENARESVLRIDIDQMRSTGLSLMPEGLERDVDVQGMADLLAYLRTLE